MPSPPYISLLFLSGCETAAAIPDAEDGVHGQRTVAARRDQGQIPVADLHPDLSPHVRRSPGPAVHREGRARRRRAALPVQRGRPRQPHRRGHGEVRARMQDGQLQGSRWLNQDSLCWLRHAKKLLP